MLNRLRAWLARREQRRLAKIADRRAAEMRARSQQGGAGGMTVLGGGGVGGADAGGADFGGGGDGG